MALLDDIPKEIRITSIAEDRTLSEAFVAMEELFVPSTLERIKI